MHNLKAFFCICGSDDLSLNKVHSLNHFVADAKTQVLTCVCTFIFKHVIHCNALLSVCYFAGDSPPGLSKEITHALSGMPGFEVDPFSSDDTLRMEPLALDGLSMLTDGDLMLADPAVEDSFRSDRLK